MGITYDKEQDKFVFDFEHDGANDIVSLTGSSYQVEAFGKCFYYGYEFGEAVDGGVRGAFIKYVKFSESSSKVNQYMLRYIYRFAQPRLHKMELIKSLPENISFDMDAYAVQYLDDVLENGRPRYTEKQKDEVKQSINDMMDLIHKKDYFTIAKDVKKSRFRPYMMNFLRFKSEEDKALCATIRKQNVLIVDDVTTSGSTLNEILRALRVLNEDNRITIFSLIGRKDLMVESF